MTKKIEVSDETYEKIKSQLTQEETKELNSFEDLIGETFCFQCARYIYHGEVEKVNTEFITLKNASVVFETGSYNNTEAEDKQSLPNKCQILKASIESFYKLNW